MSQLRKFFGVPRDVTYLNVAYLAPMMTSALKAGTTVLTRASGANELGIPGMQLPSQVSACSLARLHLVSTTSCLHVLVVSTDPLRFCLPTTWTYPCMAMG